MSIKIIVADSEEIASRQAASLVRKQLNKKPNSALLLPTGSTPLQMYELLIEKVKNGKISFAHAVTFNLDEYLDLPTEHPQSYRSFMENNFFNKIDIKKTNISIPNGLAKNKKQHCLDYENNLQKAKIDLAILGIGENGHIGFNEPGTDFNSVTHIADLTPSTIKANARFFESKEDVPKQAITTGLKTILSAKTIILLAFGKNKAQAVKSAVEKEINTKVPASILQKHKNVIFILDQDAASKLTKTHLHPPVLEGVKLYSEFNLPKNKTVVFFSPHPDDASICSGALLTALSKQNKVYELIVTTGHRAVSDGQALQQRIKTREKEVKQEAKVLGVKPILLRSRFYDNGDELCESDMKKIRSWMKKIKPDIAFVPHKLDPHPTHVLSRKIALASLPHNISLWNFETPWGLFAHKKFNAVFEFSEDLMDIKLKAIRKHVSQIERTSFDDAAENIARFRSITIAEQLFSELGKKPLKTQPYLELYRISKW